jgi:TRAP-type mannitol/chloroaromatic compound transport system permease small subunit
MKWLRIFISIVNNLNDWTGKIVSMLIYPMILMLVWEVLMRYFFERPTSWANELSSMLYAVSFLLGGAYTLRWEGHIRMDVIYARLSTRKRALVDILTSIFFYLFAGVLLWESAGFAWRATVQGEVSISIWGPPIWPIKLCVPLGASLILLQGVVKTIGDVFTAFTGQELPSVSLEKKEGTR